MYVAQPVTRNSARQALQSHEWKIVALYLLVISRACTCRHLDPIYFCFDPQVLYATALIISQNMIIAKGYLSSISHIFRMKCIFPRKGCLEGVF